MGNTHTGHLRTSADALARVSVTIEKLRNLALIQGCDFGAFEDTTPNILLRDPDGDGEAILAWYVPRRPMRGDPPPPPPSSWSDIPGVRPWTKPPNQIMLYWRLPFTCASAICTARELEVLRFRPLR